MGKIYQNEVCMQKLYEKLSSYHLSKSCKRRQKNRHTMKEWWIVGYSCCGLIAAACCVVPICWGTGSEKTHRQQHRLQKIPM